MCDICLLACPPACLPACLPACMSNHSICPVACPATMRTHAHMHTCIHTFIHAHMHMLTKLCSSPDMLYSNRYSIFIFVCLYAQVDQLCSSHKPSVQISPTTVTVGRAYLHRKSTQDSRCEYRRIYISVCIGDTL